MKELGLQINCHSYILKDFPPEITKLEKFALSINLIPEFVPPDAELEQTKGVIPYCVSPLLVELSLTASSGVLYVMCICVYQ